MSNFIAGAKKVMDNTLLEKNIANCQKAIDIPSPTEQQGMSNYQVNGNDERHNGTDLEAVGCNLECGDPAPL